MLQTKIKKKYYLLVLLVFLPIQTKENNKKNNLETFKKIFDKANDAFLQKNFEKAIVFYKEAVEINKAASVYFNIGMAYYNLKNVTQAIKYFDKALEKNPNYYNAHHALGLIYSQQKNYNAAIKHLKQTIRLNKKDVDSYAHLGANFMALKQYEQAESYFKSAATKSPQNKALVYNTAYALKLQGKYQEAIPYYLKTIECDPEFEHANLGLAKSYLAIGDFYHGWPYFEWRFLNYKEHKSRYNYRHLTPQDLVGKIILLRAEWGLGDMIQFMRYIELVKNLETTVYVQMHRPLHPLCKLCPYIDKVLAQNSKCPPFHLQIPIMSLPLIFKTTRETIPTNIPYLYADKNLVQYWKEKLAHNKNFKVGICWHAKPIFLEDNPLTKRSVPLKDFAVLAQVNNVSFYSLQKIYGLKELETIPKGFKVHTFGPDFDDSHGRFMDTSAVIQNLDLVVTADTSIVHLAGALGKPVWILIPYVPEWRWLQNIDTTPWYPNARLFRQSKPSDWTHVMLEVKKMLEKTIRKK